MTKRVRVYRSWIEPSLDDPYLFVHVYIYAHTLKHAVQLLNEKLPKTQWNNSHVTTWAMNEIGKFPVGTLIKE